MNNANKLNNLEEIGKFLETYNLFRLYQEEIKNLDRLTTSNKIESLTIKNSHQKSPRPDSFKGEFDQIFKDLILVLLKVSQNTEEEGILPNCFYEDSITLILKLDKTTTIKENYKPISLMNIDVKILNKILANQIQQYIKRIINHDQGGFIEGMQELFNIPKSNNMIYQMNKTKDKDHTVISIDVENHLIKFITYS